MPIEGGSSKRRGLNRTFENFLIPEKLKQNFSSLWTWIIEAFLC